MFRVCVDSDPLDEPDQSILVRDGAHTLYKLLCGAAVTVQAFALFLFQDAHDVLTDNEARQRLSRKKADRAEGTKSRVVQWMLLWHSFGPRQFAVWLTRRACDDNVKFFRTWELTARLTAEIACRVVLGLLDGFPKVLRQMKNFIFNHHDVRIALRVAAETILIVHVAHL